MTKRIRPWGTREASSINFEHCPILTQQSQTESTDINIIMERWTQHGVVPTHVNSMAASYGDFAGIGGYQEMLNRMKEADRRFLELPSKVRARMGNDPAVLLDFIGNPENLEEAQELGILPSPEPELKPPISNLNQPTPEPGANAPTPANAPRDAGGENPPKQ